MVEDAGTAYQATDAELGGSGGTRMGPRRTREATIGGVSVGDVAAAIEFL
jgi:hypothetical protein